MSAPRPLSELESIISDSIDLLRRGLSPEARHQLRLVIEEYETHYPHLLDARIAAQYNYFLACLNQHDAPDSTETISALITLFKELTEPTTISLEVSRQLSLFFHNTQIKVDQGLVEELRALLDRDFDAPQELRDTRFLLEAHIRPTTIAQLSPIDSGLLCYTLAKQSMSIVTLPSWMRKIYRSQMRTPQIPSEVNEALTLFMNFYHEGIYHEAYQELLFAFEWAVYCAPIFAFEWVIGLILLESFSEVEKLAYLPALPLERRVTLTIKMHRDFASLLADEREAERLALHHWQEVISLSQHHLQVIEHRHRDLSTHRSEDLETQGWLKIRITEGLIAQGDDLHAQATLSPVASKARIDTYRDPVLSATALSLSGMIKERLGDTIDASTDYYNALSRAIPKTVLSYEDVIDLERWALDQAGGDQRLLLITLGIKRSCDLIRLTGHPEALADLDLLSLLLTNLSHSLPYEEYLETLIYLGLSYAQLGESDGAKRSLEAAQALDHISGVALSNLFLLRAWKRELTLQSDEPAKLRPQYERVLKEVEGARGGEVQRQLQLSSALLFLQVNLPQYHAMSAEDRVSLGDRIEGILKRTYDSFASSALRSHLCLFSLLIPRISNEELEGQVKALLSFPECQSAGRWLVKIIKETDHPYYFIPPKRETSALIKEEHFKRFERRWIAQEEISPNSYKIYDQLTTRRDTPAWPQRALNPQEAKLEYFVFDDWLVAYLTTRERKVVTQQIEVSRQELERDIQEFMNALIDANEPQYLFNEASQRLYHLLIEPFAEALRPLHRLIISPSDLLMQLPFSALLDREGQFLGERLEIATALSTADPVFSQTVIPREGSTFCHIDQELGVQFEGDDVHTLFDVVEEASMSAQGSKFNAFTPQSWLEESHSVLEKSAHFKGINIVTLNAEFSSTGSVQFSGAHPNHRFDLSLSETVRALVHVNASSCIVTQNLSPFAIPQRSIQTLLTSVHGGLIHCRWRGAYFESLLSRLLSRLSEGSLLIGMMGALTHLRRTAIQERHHPREWACFELYVAQHQLK